MCVASDIIIFITKQFTCNRHQAADKIPGFAYAWHFVRMCTSHLPRSCFFVVVNNPLVRGSKRTPTTPLCFRVSRVTHAEPRSDSRTHCHSKIARKTCVLQFVLSAPPLPTLQRRWQHPKSVGATASISYATGGSSGLLVHDLTPCRSA